MDQEEYNSIQACNEVATGKYQVGFAVVRPHRLHAKSAKASGFRFMNNVAIGARYLQVEHVSPVIILYI